MVVQVVIFFNVLWSSLYNLRSHVLCFMFSRRTDKTMESSCEPSEAADKPQEENRSGTPKAAGTQRTPQQNAPGHESASQPDVESGTGEQNTAVPETSHTDRRRRRHKHRGNKQVTGGAESGGADHLTHAAPSRQQKKRNPKHLNANSHMASVALMDDSTAPDDDGGGETQQQKKKKKQKKKLSSGNTEKSESGAVGKPNTPLKLNAKPQGKVCEEHTISCVMS